MIQHVKITTVLQTIKENIMNVNPVNDTTKESLAFEMNEEHEIRYYLRQILACMKEEEGYDSFKPTYIITAVKLPTGAIELAVNSANIEEKIRYILEAYDGDMRLKTNADIVMQNIMVV